MRTSLSIVAVIGFQMLSACGGEVERVPGEPAPPPVPVEVPSAPAAPTPAAPAPGAPAPAPASLERTDLGGDLEADAICAANARRVPAGTFTADPSFELSSATDVAVVAGADGRLELYFQFPSEISAGPVAGQLVRADVFHLMSLTLDPRASAPDPLAVGMTTGSFLDELPWRSICSNLPISYGGAAYGDGADSAKVVITARTATMVEASLEITRRKDGSVANLAFHAPIVPANPFVESRVCCLKAR